MPQPTKLFEPINIGNVELRNRLVMLPMATLLGTERRVNEKVKAFYAERAAGGVGLIDVGILTMADAGPAMANQISIYDDEFVPGLSELTATIHAHGAKAFAQLGLERYWRRDKDAPPELVSPSGVAVRGGEPPRALSREEIQLIVQQFAQAARRARGAGFDGIEIHAATGFLLSQFISPHTNLRSDGYGGSLEDRLRFPLEVVAALRGEVGEGFPIVCKISGDDFMQGGNTLDDVKTVASMLERGGVSALNVAAGWHESPVPVAVSMVPQGGFAYLAEGIKSAVRIPVMAAYRIVNPMVAEDILAQGKADLVGMARAFLADPELANKAREGRLEDIRPCIACCRCLDLVLHDQPPRCSVNPRMGRETEYAVEPAATRKKVFVVGGGAAGMEAARLAAQRGHEVTLFERSDRLGGQLLLAAVAPFKDEIAPFNAYLRRQVERSGARVELNSELAAEAIAQANPDEVVLAVGASPLVPDIPGVDGDNVVMAVEVLKGEKDVGQRVVVVGGGMVGCEVAELLLERGKGVTVLEMLGRMGQDIGPSNRWVVLQRLKRAGTRMETKATASQITEQGVRVEREGGEEFFAADTVVLAVGMKANSELAAQLRGKVSSLHVVGDASDPRRIMEAIAEGFLAGSRI